MTVGSNINPNFPIPGVDQSSRGFRDNFSIIKQEIENLQSKNIQIVGAMVSDPIEIGNSQSDIVIHVDAGNIQASGSNLSVQYNLNSVMTGSQMYYNNGRVGINTSTPSQPLHVYGNIQVSNTTVATGILFPDGTFQKTAAIGGGGISDAPVDGNQYNRKDASWVRQEDCFLIAVTDETTNISVGNSQITFHMPYSITTTGIIAGLTTTSSSGSVVSDIKVNGASMFTVPNRPTIVAGNTTVETTSIANVNIAKLSTVTVDIVSAGTNAKGLKIYFNGRRA